MLSNPTQHQTIKVDNKIFNVVPVVLDKKGYTAPKTQSGSESNKKNSEPSQVSAYKEEYEDNDAGWINVDDDEVSEKDAKVIEKEEEEEKLVDIVEDTKPVAKTKEGIDKYTHFFSIPLNAKGFLDQLKKLHLDLYRNFEEKFNNYLQPAEKMHVTLIMLNLASEEKLKKLAEIKDKIQQEIKKITNNQTLSLKLGDLGIFEKYDKRLKEKLARVLYASVKENSTLIIIKDIIHSLVSLLISEKILSLEDFSHMRYNSTTKRYELDAPHATIINIPDDKLRDDDLRLVWTKLKRFSWDEVPINEIHISTRGEYSENGYYKPLYRFDLS